MPRIVVVCGVSILILAIVIIAFVFIPRDALLPEHGNVLADAEDNKENENESSWLKDTSDITLSWYIHAPWYSKRWDSLRTLYDMTVTDITGVNLEIIVPPGSGDEKLIAMTLSGEMPDIMTIDNWNKVRQQMISNGYFLALDMLATKYAPELHYFVPESMKLWNTQPDGHWYAISNFFTAPELLNEDSRIDNANGIIARTDLMLKLGIAPDDFTTKEGVIEALKLVYRSELTNEGNRVLPICLDWNDWVLSRMWGIPWERADGTFQHFKTHPNYVDIYIFLNELWREGLIAKDNLTVWAGEHIAQGICFSFIGNIDSIYSSMKELYRLNNDALYSPVGPILTSENHKPVFDQAGTGWMSTFITSKSEHPDRAVRLLSFMMSEEGQILNWFGVEGQTFKWVDGRIRFTDDYMSLRLQDQALTQEIYGFEEFWPLKQQSFYTKYIKKEELDPFTRNFEQIVDFFSRFAVLTPETMAATVELGTQESTILHYVERYWEEKRRHMIMAASEEEVRLIYGESLEHIMDIGFGLVEERLNVRYQHMKQLMRAEFDFPDYE